MVPVTFFDGRSSRAHPATLAVEAQQAVLRDADGAELRRAPLSQLRVSERVRRAPRLVTFADGAFCEVADHAAFDRLLAATGHRDSLVARAQNSWRLAGLAVAALVAVLVLGYYVLLPWGAGMMARAVPAELEARLGQLTLESLDRGLLAPTQLPAAEQARIRTGFAALRRPRDTLHDYQILFRQGGEIGANALALPGGTLIVTDELVALAGTGAGMMGVLAHEAGHVARRHGLQQVIQGSALAALSAYLFGDISSVLAGVPAAMLTLRYSRDHEREADAYAIDVMQRNGLPPAALADVLVALEQREGKPDEAQAGRGEDFLSTHPHTQARIDALRRAGK
ncbi:putative Peptidase, M48 Ste24p family; putative TRANSMEMBRANE PROTEIN [Cupriavidus taiwanensis]|uniref:Peptidase, M48 Ste24p family putative TRANSMEMBRANE PROTEIN n=1 Tax=Cupriavidus taiwanensis TaxID=164546 RepID=A0A975WZ16_9BURK|nr:M48 family metallopeptidase [Cupriavidus taiwanensis]SOY49229.1 putative Peptidase, M48 Ste24p family; putative TRANSMEMBRANE PROTEIN [Cupriavidus taiwanensis]